MIWSPTLVDLPRFVTAEPRAVHHHHEGGTALTHCVGSGWSCPNQDKCLRGCLSEPRVGGEGASIPLGDVACRPQGIQNRFSWYWGRGEERRSPKGLRPPSRQTAGPAGPTGPPRPGPPLDGPWTAPGLLDRRTARPAGPTARRTRISIE